MRSINELALAKEVVISEEKSIAMQFKEAVSCLGQIDECFSVLFPDFFSKNSLNGDCLSWEQEYVEDNDDEEEILLSPVDIERKKGHAFYKYLIL